MTIARVIKCSYDRKRPPQQCQQLPAVQHTCADSQAAESDTAAAAERSRHWAHRPTTHQTPATNQHTSHVTDVHPISQQFQLIQISSRNPVCLLTINIHCPAATCAFSALMLLVGRQEGHPACKKQSGGVLAWLSVWSKVQTCIWPS